MPPAPPAAAQNVFVSPFSLSNSLVVLHEISGCCCSSGSYERCCCCSLDASLFSFSWCGDSGGGCGTGACDSSCSALLCSFTTTCSYSFCFVSSYISCCIWFQIACKTPSSPFCSASIHSRFWKSNWPSISSTAHISWSIAVGIASLPWASALRLLDDFSLGYAGQSWHIFGLRMLQLVLRLVPFPFLYRPIGLHKREPIAPPKRDEKGGRPSSTKLTQARAGVTSVRCKRVCSTHARGCCGVHRIVARVAKRQEEGDVVQRII